MNRPKIVTADQWLTARKELLATEKEFTHKREALAAARRKLPMVRIDKDYVFEGPKGSATLLDLFFGHDQLIVYHFMLDPSWTEGCKGCSFIMDSLSGNVTHLAARNTSLVSVSRAPMAAIALFQKRMGWSVPWYSSFGNAFNYDFHVTLDPNQGDRVYNYSDVSALKKAGKRSPTEGEAPGLSVFLRDGEDVYHTYSTYARGLDIFLTTYNLLDVTPLGRQEEPGKGMAWLRHHDRYEPEPLIGLGHCCEGKA